MKVFPNSFTFFKNPGDSQNILTPSGEPLALCCSDECLFVAVEARLLEVYLLHSWQLLGQIRTIDTVVQLLYSCHGDCIVTLERKAGSAHSFARVYFKWRGSSVEKPVRVSLISSLPRPGGGADRIAAEIVELPTSDDASCLACCQHSGRVAVATGSTVRVFVLKAERGSPEATPTSSIELLFDVHTATPDIKKIAIFGDNLAFISSYEARVLRLSLTGGGLTTAPPFQFSGGEERGERDIEASVTSLTSSVGIPKDASFVSWSPSIGWEAERQAVSKEGPPGHVTKPHPPEIGTVSLTSVSRSVLSKWRASPGEVLGPTEDIIGQPVEVELDSSSGYQRCRVLTLLYRCFPATPPTACSGSKGTPSKVAEEGLHTVQLVPTIVEGEGGPQLVGLACFLANTYHGYLYDVHQQTKLSSSFSFMERSLMALCDGSFLHTLSADSLESFSSRAFPTAMADVPQTSSIAAPDRCGEAWLKQPCPPSNLDLMLLASNKFVGCCDMAASQEHLVVLTKVEAQTLSAGSWLMQSLRPSPKSEQLWNIYVLRKSSLPSMYQQFMESAAAMKEGSPPMSQHLLSEGHLLLRRELVCGGSSPTSTIGRSLRENAFSLADSLCSYSVNQQASSSSAGYFILSGVSIATVIKHITANFPKPSPAAYAALMHYLRLVLFDSHNAASQAKELSPLADLVIELYTDHSPQHLPSFLLHSWLEGYTHARALEAVHSCLQSPTSAAEGYLCRLCEVRLLLQLGQPAPAGAALGRIPEAFLQCWTRNNISFILDTSKQEATPLGKLMQERVPACFLALLAHCLATSTLDFAGVCHTLSAQECDKMANNTLLKQFLEQIVLDQPPEGEGGAVDQAVLLLVDILFSRLLLSEQPQPSSSSPFGLYGSRHRWLDNVPPFDTVSDLADTPSQTTLQDLMQLQALLCSCHMSEGAARQVEGWMRGREGGGEEREGVPGATSIKLLTWPYTGKLWEAVDLMLECCPTVALDYCLSFFSASLTEWRRLLDTLLGRLSGTGQQQSELHATYRSVYRGVLGHVVTISTPGQLLSLLPPSGSVDFFLPLIEHSCRLHAAQGVAKQLHTTILHQ